MSSGKGYNWLIDCTKATRSEWQANDRKDLIITHAQALYFNRYAFEGYLGI